MTKIILGLSGGVDSSVAAYLLKQQGYIVEALFMKNWEEDDTNTYCSAAQDLEDAQAVCDKLNIRLHTVNFAKEYWDKVFTYFLEEYKRGRTPNPDVLCNKEIKFKAFLDYAVNNLQADYIATGHYARVKKINNNFYLLKALDNSKDQSYFLHALNQEQLSRAIFPLGAVNKTTVREIAKKLDLITHDKKDSTGICFIGERDFKQFLSKYLPARPGHIVDQNNNILGKHDGLMYYTIGQRKGLNLGGLKNYSQLPWYVADKNLDNNNLIVVQADNHPHELLDKTSCNLENLHFINPEYKDQFDQTTELLLKIKSRYRQPDQDARIYLNTPEQNTKVTIKFTLPQRAITPGQSMVFYGYDDPSICLGGATIC